MNRYRNARQTEQRRAAILVCVMVVLLIVGLLSAQTIQTLVVVRRGDEQRARLRQAIELVELGQLAVDTNQVPADGVMVLMIEDRRCTIRVDADRIVASIRWGGNAEVTASRERKQ